MYMYVCIYIYISIYIYIHIYTYIYIYTYIHARMYIFWQQATCAGTGTEKKRIYIYTYVYIYIHIHIHIYIYTYTHTHIHIDTNTHIHIYKCIRIYIFIYIYTDIHTYVRTYKHTNKRTNKRTNEHTHIALHCIALPCIALHYITYCLLYIWQGDQFFCTSTTSTATTQPVALELRWGCPILLLPDLGAWRGDVAAGIAAARGVPGVPCNGSNFASIVKRYHWALPDVTRCQHASLPKYFWESNLPEISKLFCLDLIIILSLFATLSKHSYRSNPPCRKDVYTLDTLGM